MQTHFFNLWIIFFIEEDGFRGLNPNSTVHKLGKASKMFFKMNTIIRKPLMIKGFQIIVFIFIVISPTFRLICPPAFFRCLSNLGTFTKLRTTSFIESTGVACSDSISHNRVQVLSIPVLLLTCSQDWTCNLQMIISLEA